MDIQAIIYLIAFFFIYSFLGWVLESVTKTISQKKLVNSGFLYGPFCPIYGLGAVWMILILKSFEGNYITIFILSFIIFTIWEYFVGWLLEKVFHTKYWDYSYYKFQIKGRVCLVNSLTWGFLGVAFTELIHPVVTYIISLLPSQIISVAVPILIIYLIIDFVVTSIKIKNIKIKIYKFNEITNNLKEKIEELKASPKKGYKIKKAIEELKQKQAELKETIEKQTQRLRDAFPKITFEKISERLKRKVETRKANKK